MTELELLKKIATEFVCPNSHEALTPYEIGYVKTLVSFALKLKEAGYRLPAGKAPLLTDEEIWQALDTPHPDDIVDAFKENCRNIAKAQNDADHKFYTGGKE